MARKKTDEEWKEIYAQKYSEDEFKLIKFHRDNKFGGGAAYEILHKKCGNHFYVDITHVSRGDKCPYCAKNKRKTESEWVQYFELNRPSKDYQLIGIAYKTEQSKNKTHNRPYYKTKHLTCGCEFEVASNEVSRRGIRCPVCVMTRACKNISQYQVVLNKLYGEKYKILEISHYMQNYYWVFDMIIQCLACGEIFCIHELNKVRCPKCEKPIISKGEECVANVLNEHHISYIPQKTWDDCRNIQPLRFDFYVPEYNLIIEYQGEHHYMPIAGWGGEENFQLVKKRDKIKKQYVLSNNYNFLEIKYDQIDDLRKIIENVLHIIENGGTYNNANIE